MCLVSPISCCHITCLWRLLVRLMNEWQSLYLFFRIMAAKHSNLSIAFRQRCSNFPEGEENQNTKSKTESWWRNWKKLVKAFLVAENESQQRKDLPQADFLSCTWRIYSVSKNLLNNSEFCWLKIRPIVCFCSDLMHVYTVSVPMHFTIVIWSVDPFVLIH